MLAAFLLIMGSAQLTACGGAKKETGQVMSSAENASEDEVPSAEGTSSTRAETADTAAGTGESETAAQTQTQEPDNAVNAEIEQKEIAAEGDSVVEIPQFVTPSGRAPEAWTSSIKRRTASHPSMRTSRIKRMNGPKSAPMSRVPAHICRPPSP